MIKKYPMIRVGLKILQYLKNMTFWFLHNTKKSGQVWWGWGQKHCNRSRIANLTVFAAVSTSKPTRSQ